MVHDYKRVDKDLIPFYPLSVNRKVRIEGIILKIVDATSGKFYNWSFPENHTHYVYVAEMDYERRRLIKIGQTCDLDRRLNDYKKQSPKLLFTVKCKNMYHARNLEAHLLYEFRFDKYKYDYFQIFHEGPLQDLIKEHANV